jgi:hypothetical protein
MFSSMQIEEEEKKHQDPQLNKEASDKSKTESSEVTKSSFASSSTNERINNEVDIYKILNNEEKRTTIMIRNIPNKFKQMTLLEMINANHHSKYDYFYLPMDLKVIFIHLSVLDSMQCWIRFHQLYPSNFHSRLFP